MAIITIEDLLNDTAVGCGWHDLPIDGGVVRVRIETLEAAAELAYDPSNPCWPDQIDVAADK